jgi:hypothetical protein
MEYSAEEYQKLVMENYTRIWDNFDSITIISRKLFSNVCELHDKMIDEPDNLLVKLEYVRANSFLDGLTLGLMAVMMGTRKVD